MEFTSKITDVWTYYYDTVHGKEGENNDVNIYQIRIDWTVEIETRSWGIKSIEPVIKDFEFTVYSDDEEDDETSLKGIERTFKSSEFEVIIDLDGEYSINSCEIDFKSKTITLSA